MKGIQHMYNNKRSFDGKNSNGARRQNFKRPQRSNSGGGADVVNSILILHVL